jgi:hypothetical protein
VAETVPGLQLGIDYQLNIMRKFPQYLLISEEKQLQMWGTILFPFTAANGVINHPKGMANHKDDNNIDHSVMCSSL